MEKPKKIFTDLVDKAVAAANSMHRDELLFSYKGIRYPITICSPETFKALESFEARSDDIVLAGYLKSGTNWLSQIINDLIAVSKKKTQGRESNVNDEELGEFPYLEVGDAEKYERMTKLPCPRFMVTHLRPENLPKSIFKNKVKILLLLRNPKDVATSFYHFSNGIATLPSYETWDDFFTDFMTKKLAWGCYLEYLSEWNKYIDEENIMTITYEELKENRALGVKNIAAFLGIPLTEEELQFVAERSSFQSMKKNSENTHGAFGDVFFRKGTNWLEQMVKELADAKYTEEEMKERINAEKKLETFQRLEFGDPGIYERMKQLPSRRIIVTHLRPDLLPPSIFQSKAKILVLVRNPKDTAVSYYHFCNDLPALPSSTSWDEFFADFMNGKLAWGSYFDCLVEWNKYIDNETIMTISYEELKEDPIVGMKKIASFFGFSLCEEDFPRIAKKTSFKAMKEKSNETHGKFGDVLFRKGVVGNWRDLFSKAQNEEMFQKFQESLGGTKMAAKIKYDVYCKA